MVSLSGSSVSPVMVSNEAFRSVRFSRTMLFQSFKQRKESNGIICACMAPPQNLRNDESFATRFNVKNLSQSIFHYYYYFFVNVYLNVVHGN